MNDQQDTQRIELYRQIAAESGFPDRLICISESCNLTGLSKSRLWQLEKEGRFPLRIRLGHRSSFHRLSEVLMWLNNPTQYSA